MSLLKTLLLSPRPLPCVSKYIVANGLFYLTFGAALAAWPGMVQTIFRDPPFAAAEAQFLRLVALTLGVIGWQYFWGGRSGAQNIIAASVVGRLCIPLALAPLILTGTMPHLLTTFAILDPVLAVGAWILLSRTPVDYPIS